MTELTKFFKVGVTAASATRGLAMAAPTDAMTAAETASVRLSELQRNKQHMFSNIKTIYVPDECTAILL